jgi:hypothetical protein
MINQLERQFAFSETNGTIGASATIPDIPGYRARLLGVVIEYDTQNPLTLGANSGNVSITDLENDDGYDGSINWNLLLPTAINSSAVWTYSFGDRGLTGQNLTVTAGIPSGSVNLDSQVSVWGVYVPC